MNFDEFRQDDIAVFGRDNGVSASSSKGRLLIFKNKKIGKLPWEVIAEFPLSKVRSVVPVDGVAGTSNAAVVSGSGLHAAGVGAGNLIKGSIDKARARRQTGIVVRLAWTEEPEIFIDIADDKKRTQLIECFRQIFEGQQPDAKVQIIPGNVIRSFPTADMIETQKTERIEGSNRQKRLLIFAAAAIPVVLAIGAFQLQQSANEEQLTFSVRHYLDTLASEPQVLATGSDGMCDRLRTGYTELLDRENGAVTHVTTQRVEFEGTNQTVRQGLAVAIDESRGAFIVGQNTHYYTSGAPADLRSWMPLPGGIEAFRAIVEPTC